MRAILSLYRVLSVFSSKWFRNHSGAARDLIVYILSCPEVGFSSIFQIHEQDHGLFVDPKSQKKTSAFDEITQGGKILGDVHNLWLKTGVSRKIYRITRDSSNFAVQQENKTNPHWVLERFLEETKDGKTN